MGSDNIASAGRLLRKIKILLLLGIYTTIAQALPASLEQVTYIGIYAKNTRSEFTKIERVQDDQ